LTSESVTAENAETKSEYAKIDSAISLVSSAVSAVRKNCADLAAFFRTGNG
jgi:hypothetical protein